MNEFTVTVSAILYLIMAVSYFAIVHYSNKHFRLQLLKEAQCHFQFVEANKLTNIKRHSVGQITHDCPVCGKNYSYWQERACKAEHDWQELSIEMMQLKECCKAAIKAGDWVVDGACDPDLRIDK